MCGYQTQTAVGQWPATATRALSHRDIIYDSARLASKR